jgi:hypothetical protein
MMDGFKMLVQINPSFLIYSFQEIKMRVIIRGNWTKYVGTDYTDALGIFDSLEDAQESAEDYAWSVWEDDADDYDDEDGEYIGQGPDYYVEEYNPDKHDRHRSSGGSFENEFDRMEA